MRLLWVLAVCLAAPLVGCGAVSSTAFAPASKCYIQGSVWRLEANGKPCGFYSDTLALALGNAAAAGVVDAGELAAAVSGSNVWVHMEGVMCGGAGADGCTVWRPDGAYEIHVGGNGGAILHELLHVVQVRSGMAPEDSASHPGWKERGWTAVADSFNQTMADRDRVMAGLSP